MAEKLAIVVYTGGPPLRLQVTLLLTYLPICLAVQVHSYAYREGDRKAVYRLLSSHVLFRKSHFRLKGVPFVVFHDTPYLNACCGYRVLMMVTKACRI